jgi:dienelactone hydrolase
LTSLPLSQRFNLLLAIFLLGCAPAIAQPLAFDADTVGGPASEARGEFFAPAGAGPFPAVVVLHGCDGVGRHDRLWARQLASWGYVALIVDSFRPRGMNSICNHGMLVPPQLQALDGFNAANYLRTQPNVSGERIGVIGFSHGGWAVLKAVLADLVSQASTKPFAAAVAFYPGCAAFGTADRHAHPDRRGGRLDAGRSLRALARHGGEEWACDANEDLSRCPARFRRAGDAAFLRWPLYRA